MIRRTLAAAACLLGAAPIAIGLYWAFLSTPESNALTLALSAFLAVALVLVAAFAVNASLQLAAGASGTRAVRSALRGVPWALAVAAPLFIGVWGIRRGDAWVGRYSGEIGAWFIATIGWADATPLLRAADYASVWLRWVVLPVAALAALAAALQHGARGLVSSPWLRSGWHWRTLAIATAAFIVLMALPWQLAFWRPVTLPPTWVQPAAAALRLAMVALMLATGAGLIVAAVARAVSAPPRTANPVDPHQL